MSEVAPASSTPAAGATAQTLVHSVADPAPLGLAAFAMTTFALSIGNTNVWGPGGDAALALALVYGGFAQLLAGMWEFKRRNTFGALAFTSYGAFWISYYVFVKFVAPGVTAADAPVAVGVFLLGWLIFTTYMIVPATGVNGAVLAVFVLLAAAFLFLTIGAFQSNALALDTWTKIGGWLGVATAAAAWYTSFAGVTNETLKRTVLPVFPLTK
jgi:uncharacterized protein